MVSQDPQDLGHFSRNIGLVKDRTESDAKGGYKRHKLQQKYIDDVSSLFWPGSRIKEKSGWDPGTCLPIRALIGCCLAALETHGRAKALERCYPAPNSSLNS